MKKVLAAVAAGALLIAGQAAAQNTAAARVGDRIGAEADASSEFSGVPISLVVAAAVLVTVLVVSNDDSDSD